MGSRIAEYDDINREAIPVLPVMIETASAAWLRTNGYAQTKQRKSQKNVMIWDYLQNQSI